MKLPLYIVSDNHFLMQSDHQEKSRRLLIFDLFEKIRSSGGTLIIGGDFFDFWFNYKSVLPSFYTDIIYELNRLNQNNVEIHFLAGNHDYWDFGLLNSLTGCTFHKGDFEFILDKKKILVTHGDGLLSFDHGYRLMKKIIRSKTCIFLFGLLHPDWGCALARFVSTTEEKYDKIDRNHEKIKQEIQSFARDKWKDGYDTVLVGHYHNTGFYESNDSKMIWLGDWLTKFTVTKYDQFEWSQVNWNENQKITKD
jgi:UDP-2,3-diacylglucosamine hydrolase